MAGAFGEKNREIRTIPENQTGFSADITREPGFWAEPICRQQREMSGGRGKQRKRGKAVAGRKARTASAGAQNAAALAG
jgi:hypothetical protein